jgi:hypothetical protein
MIGHDQGADGAPEPVGCALSATTCDNLKRTKVLKMSHYILLLAKELLP